MAEKSSAYFPLRSNAPSLLAGPARCGDVEATLAGAGFGASMATGATPGVGDVVSVAAGYIGEKTAEYFATPAWLSMHRGIRRLPREKAGGMSRVSGAA